MQLVFQQHAIIAHLSVQIVMLGRICKHHNLGCVHVVVLPAQTMHAGNAPRGFLSYLENYDPYLSLKGYFSLAICFFPASSFPSFILFILDCHHFYFSLNIFLPIHVFFIKISSSFVASFVTPFEYTSELQSLLSFS